MSNELKVIPRAVEYNVYDFIFKGESEDLNAKLFEIETNTRHQEGELIYFRDEEGVDSKFIVQEISHELYKHRLSETTVRWNFIHHYALKEI